MRGDLVRQELLAFPIVLWVVHGESIHTCVWFYSRGSTQIQGRDQQLFIANVTFVKQKLCANWRESWRLNFQLGVCGSSTMIPQICLSFSNGNDSLSCNGQSSSIVGTWANIEEVSVPTSKITTGRQQVRRDTFRSSGGHARQLEAPKCTQAALKPLHHITISFV